MGRVRVVFLFPADWVVGCCGSICSSSHCLPPKPLYSTTFTLHLHRGNSGWLGGLGAGKRAYLSCPRVWYPEVWLKKTLIALSISSGSRLCVSECDCAGGMRSDVRDSPSGSDNRSTFHDNLPMEPDQMPKIQSLHLLLQQSILGT
ncbi:hypothetical protein F5144DRAFT_138793 [Chaetomium tenue]|uniref:Uncharacterized protein n=1 Tax=Chaetomium tenue TaxID=1854479 RepID=A0ACB7PJ09_9PEZI|nr:hypothetical protein F5144DRAFT_138793 [Chaetomium globosum]